MPKTTIELNQDETITLLVPEGSEKVTGTLTLSNANLEIDSITKWSQELTEQATPVLNIGTLPEGSKLTINVSDSRDIVLSEGLAKGVTLTVHYRPPMVMSPYAAGAGAAAHAFYKPVRGQNTQPKVVVQGTIASDAELNSALSVTAQDVEGSIKISRGRVTAKHVIGSITITHMGDIEYQTQSDEANMTTARGTVNTHQQEAADAQPNLQ